MSSEKCKEKEKYVCVCPSDSDSDESVVFEPVTNGKVVAQKVSQFDKRNSIHSRLLDLTPAFHSSSGKYTYMYIYIYIRKFISHCFAIISNSY